MGLELGSGLGLADLRLTLTLALILTLSLSLTLTDLRFGELIWRSRRDTELLQPRVHRGLKGACAWLGVGIG